MKRCIVNVATDRYAPLQQRLVRSLAAVGYKDGLLTWTDRLPPGSPRHPDVPYAFKLFAIREAARRGARSVLWLDAPCVAARRPDPIFDRIEQEGHLFVMGDERLGNWASDECLATFALSRDEAMEVPLMNGTFIGLDLSNPRTRMWFDELVRCSQVGLFSGPYFSHHAPRSVRAKKPGKPQGLVSKDPRCWGHRHDEAVGSCLAFRMDLRLSPAGEFLGDADRGTAIIRKSKA